MSPDRRDADVVEGNKVVKEKGAAKKKRAAKKKEKKVSETCIHKPPRVLRPCGTWGTHLASRVLMLWGSLSPLSVA